MGPDDDGEKFRSDSKEYKSHGGNDITLVVYIPYKISLAVFQRTFESKECKQRKQKEQLGAKDIFLKEHITGRFKY